jgi:aryl-alcohol dehydrogenase-like predicted oxidoreductase
VKYRTLGQTDIRVSTVAMGCWAIGGGSVWGPQDENEAVAAVRAALDAGVDFFDTAEAYGHGRSEELLGRALAGRRHEAVIATKATPAHLSRAGVREACEGSLRRLQTDYIDLYQIHWPSRTIPLEETVPALEGLREQGKVRALGVSNFGVEDLAAYASVGRCETNQLPYSLLWRAVEHEIAPACADRNVGILCYSPLFQGLLAGKYGSPDEVPEGRARTRIFAGSRPLARHGEAGCEAETFEAIGRIRTICEEIGEPMANVALAWLLHRPGVVSVLAGARSPAQIAETARAGDLDLLPDVVKRLAEATEDVKHVLGPNPDMWQSNSRFR